MPAKTKRRSLAAMSNTEWFHIIGLISAGALGIGFFAGLISVGLSWKINREQKIELAKLSLNKDVQIAQVRADADKKIAKTGVDVANINGKAQDIARQNIELSKNLEQEKISRLEMEQAIAPRIMEQGESSRKLKAFSGIQVIIECVNDFEARRTAGQIACTLEMANWKLIKPYPKVVPNDADFFDGVDIERNVGALPKEDRSSEATNLLIEQLDDNKIQAMYHPASPNLPINTIRVKVGLKPITYFSNKKIDEIRKTQKIFKK
jgi:hypothetical protein